MFRKYITFSLLIKCLQGQMKELCGSDEISSLAEFGSFVDL